MNVDHDILSILGRSEITGNALTLPGQLDPRTYKRVDKVLQAAGGRWNRKVGAHLFVGPAEPVIGDIILTGKVTTLL